MEAIVNKYLLCVTKSYCRNSVPKNWRSHLYSRSSFPLNKKSWQISNWLNKSIMAEYWLKVIEKDREKEMLSNKAAMMKRKKKFVTGVISIR